MSAPGDDVDLRPWAAFCLGHHPYALLRRHMDDWSAFQDWLDKFEPDYQHEDPPELEELNDALDFLSSKGLAEAVALNKFCKRREEYVAVAKEIGEIAEGTRFESDVIDIDLPWEPCYGSLSGLIEASDSVITEMNDLRLWTHLGAAIGEYPLLLTRGIDHRWESLGDCYTAIQDSIRELTLLDEYPWLAQIGSLKKLDPAADQPSANEATSTIASRLQTAADLSSKIRTGLKTQAPPEVWFDINQNRLKLFGVDFPVERPLEGAGSDALSRRLKRREAGILWLLAEKAGQPVTRSSIRKEGLHASVPDPANQPATICRMRDKIRPAVKAYYVARNWEFTKQAHDCFILSDVGGSYRLAMSKDRVRVPGERPPWMINQGKN